MILGDEPKARRDFDKAQALAPDSVVVLRRRAYAYERANRFEAAARVFDTLIAKTTDKTQLPTLLNGRCWVRAEWGRELEQGLADCEAALALRPASPQILDSRGFVRWRLGKFDDAIVDYDAALKQTPNRSASLFGRGLAEWSVGRKADATSDFAAARTASARVDAEFARYGVKAPVAAAP
jgi:tetratricopeptide (TPR) repeat protein